MKLIPDLGTVVWKSLLGFRAMHLALAAGIAAATAVIVGALVVGDSVRGSLRDLVVQRLGNIEHAMLAQRFFDPQILSQATPLAERHQLRLVPLIILPSVAIELNRQGDIQRASQVQAIGSEHDFWQLAPAAMGSAAAQLKDLSLATDEVALNASLAQELGAEVGDEITIRLPKGTGVPADSPLGRKDDAAASIPRQRVVRILPDRSVADLDFRAGQQPNRNVFLPLAALADALEQTGRANAAIAVHSAASNKIQLEVAEQQCSDINSAIRPQLEDYGLKLQRHTRVFPDKSLGEQASSEPTTIFDYFQITSDQLIIDAQSERALAAKLLPLGAQRAMSYLVNQISVVGGDDSTPPVQVTYSIATGLENWEQTAAPYFADESFLEPRLAACWVNSWLAERLNLKSGSRIQITFFKPETTDGQEIETTEEFVVAGVVPVSTPSKGYVRNRPAQFSQAPTLFNDPDLTPVVPGITDQDSISKWDLPFKLTRTIPKEDDEYWRDFRLTPKLFVRYNTAARFFGSRFGAATAFRVSARGLDEARLRELATDAMLSAKAGLGLQFMPLRQQQLKAASGTTPFDGLFLALSFFVILSALMLVALLFRLSIEQRSEQWGLLLATGFTHRRVRSLLLRESLVIIALGLLVGIGLGLGYARLMVAGLETWWVGAISRSFLEFGFTPISLLIGGLIGGSTSLVTIVISMWRLNRKTPLDLIRGRWDEADRWNAKTSKVSLAIAGFLGFGALGLLALGTTQTGMGQAGSFFGSGMLLLSAALVLATHLLKQRRSDSSQIMARRPRLLHLAWWTLTRNPWRSVLTLGLLAVASFLIASMSIFQLAPDIQGSGSFELMAESALPIYRDIGSARIREEMLGKEDFNSLRSASILCFRARLGEDASCNNLYQVAQPTILGVPEVLTQYQLSLPPEKRFQWAAASSNSEISWQNLTEFATGTPDNPIPVVIDLNTAAWSLHQGASLGAITRIVIDDREIYFKTVGLLSNSIMQGRLLISEANFAKLFPEQSGYRFFLIHAEDQSLSEVSHALENGWSDQGLDATSTAATLAKMLAVQNTYISAFQAIGALGLLLGTIGLAIVQVRSVLERRRELALLQAIGFSRSRVAHLLLLEALILLCGGLLIGVFSALVAIVPYMISSNPQLNVIEPLALLSIVLAVGLLASSIAILTALRQPLLSNLRQ